MRLVDVGLSPEVQVALGHLLHFHSPMVGQLARKGEQLFVVEGTLTAAEFYSPVEGYVDIFTDDTTISDWLVTLKPLEM